MRSVADQFFSGFLRQAMNLGVIQIRRQYLLFMAALAGDFLLLAFDIAGVLGLDFHLLGHARIGCARPDARQAQQPGICLLYTSRCV